LYLRDLEEYLSVNYVNHLECLNGYCMQHIGMYLKLFRLLHSDDTVMFAESSSYTPEISPMSYDNLLNLEFRIQVNNFLMLEVRQIARLLSKLLGLLYLYTLVLLSLQPMSRVLSQS
jgi:hypothetical protein